MDYNEEDIEEVILDEEETDSDTDSSIQETHGNGKGIQMKNVSAKKGVAEEEEEEEPTKVSKATANAAATGAGSGKFAGLYKDGTGKGAVIPGPVDTGLAGGNSAAKLNANVKAKKGMREEIDVHMDALFNGEELSEDFKTKASTIFEAALTERVDAIKAELEEEYNNRLITSIEETKTALTEQLDSYLSYVVEEWMEENKIAVERGIRTEIAEEFMSGLRNLFLEHDIMVPESKVDIADEMANTVEKLKESLNEEISKNVELTAEVKNFRKSQILGELSEDLTLTQKEKFRTLAEGVALDGEDEDVRNKLGVIKESYFGNGKTQVLTEESAATAEESLDEAPANQPSLNLSESMQVYANTLSRLSKR
jgi:hypothetical protein